MPRVRVTELRIAGMRCIDELTLPLDGLTVLIGKNGSGKSTIVEACALLRLAASEDFYRELHGSHRGLLALLRAGAKELRLGVSMAGGDTPLHYDIALARDGNYTVIAEEHLTVDLFGKRAALAIIERTRSGARVRGAVAYEDLTTQANEKLIVSQRGSHFVHPALDETKQALEGLELQLPFDVRPLWASKADRASRARTATPIARTKRLELFGANLANAYHALKNDFSAEHWRETVECIQMGLGEIENVNVRADVGGSAVALWVKLRGAEEQIPAESLADGMLSYLALVALYRLPREDRTLLAFDEPELHLHPELLVRALGFFEAMAEEHPVLLSTHSDRLLDALRDPEKSTRVCTLDSEGRARVQSLDREALQLWLDSYRGLGDLRANDLLEAVLTPSAARPA